MIRESRILTYAFLATIVVLLMPGSGIFASQSQISSSNTAEEVVRLAENAEQQVKNLIYAVYANETAIEKITDVELFGELEEQVTLYDQGATMLIKSQHSLELLDYEKAIGNATEALRIFRQVFRSINIILEDAGLRTSDVIDTYGLLEAFNRSLERIERLRALLPEEAEEFSAVLDEAEALLDLDAALQLLLEDKVKEVAGKLSQANQLISEVYQYMKQQAEASNSFRVNGYLQEMGQARERIREQFRYAGDQGLDVGVILASLGYHNETEFMQALENIIQTAQGKTGDIESVIQDLEALGQLTRQMNQALTQEINRHKEQHGTDGSGSGGSHTGSGSDGSGSGAGTSGSGSGSGYGGSGSGGSGTGSGIGSSEGARYGSGGSGSSGSGTSSSGEGIENSGSGFGGGSRSGESGGSSSPSNSGSGSITK